MAKLTSAELANKSRAEAALAEVRTSYVNADVLANQMMAGQDLAKVDAKRSEVEAMLGLSGDPNLDAAKRLGVELKQFREWLSLGGDPTDRLIAELSDRVPGDLVALYVKAGNDLVAAIDKIAGEIELNRDLYVLQYAPNGIVIKRARSSKASTSGSGSGGSGKPSTYAVGTYSANVRINGETKPVTLTIADTTATFAWEGGSVDVGEDASLNVVWNSLCKDQFGHSPNTNHRVFGDFSLKHRESADAAEASAEDPADAQEQEQEATDPADVSDQAAALLAQINSD